MSLGYKVRLGAGTPGRRSAGDMGMRLGTGVSGTPSPTLAREIPYSAYWVCE